MGDVVKTLTI